MIEIDLDTTTVIDALNQLSLRAGDLSQPLEEIGQALEDGAALSFSGATSPYGEGWEPLKHRNGVPLNDTGRLKNSLTHNVVGNSVEVGTSVEYAPTHQFGATKGQYGKTSRGAPIPWGNVPARPFLPTSEGGLPDEWEEEVLDVINNYLEFS